MRQSALLALVATLGGVACAGEDAAAPAAGPTALRADASELSGLPDLVVDGRRLANSWVVLEETIEDGSCTQVEGGVAPGVHRLLRFTVTTPNVGAADVFVGDPREHLFDGLFEFAPCHGHYHFRHYATYELVSARTGSVVLAAKRGFCMIDVTPWATRNVTPGRWSYRSCGTRVVAGNQGISVGWADTYSKWLDGQFFVVDDLPPGDYWLRVTVNPPGFTPFAWVPCPGLDPQDSACHVFAEMNYRNNLAEVLITLPAGVGRTGFGPGAGESPARELIDDENRPVER